MPLYYRVRANFSPPLGKSALVRAPATGWRPTHTLETRAKLREVAVFMPFRGVRVSANENYAFEVSIWTEFELQVGMRWSVDMGQINQGRKVFGNFEITDIFEVSQEPSWSDNSDPDVAWLVFC